MVLSTIFALFLNNVKQIFDIIIYSGAGTGLLFILRWFWWRINAWSEISAMFFSGLIAILAYKTAFFDFISSKSKLPFCVQLTIIIWLVVTYLTRATDRNVLLAFVERCNPGGPGWKRIGVSDNIPWLIPLGIKFKHVSCIMVYSGLFGTGYFLYGDFVYFFAMTAICLLCGLYPWLNRDKIEILTR